jgi:hypothetical protein
MMAIEQEQPGRRKDGVGHLGTIRDDTKTSEHVPGRTIGRPTRRTSISTTSCATAATWFQFFFTGSTYATELGPRAESPRAYSFEHLPPAARSGQT